VPLLVSSFGKGRIPSVILEIIIGIIIGKHFLNIITDEPYIDFLANTGFVFLMFLSGLEIEADHLIATFPRKKINFSIAISNPLLTGIGIYIVNLSFAYIASIYLSDYFEINSPWYFSLMMTTASVGIIVPVLKNRGEVNDRFGQMIIIAAGVADVLSILLFSFTVSFIKNGVSLQAMMIFVPILLLIIAYLVGERISSFKVFNRLMHQLEHAASQIKVRGAILLFLLFVVVSQIIGVEIVLGAFFAGLVLSVFIARQRSALLIKLDGMGYGFFIPIFFIIVGARLDLSSLTDIQTALPLLGMLFLVFYAVKIIPALIWTKLFGWKKAVSGGVLITTTLGLIIAASEIGMEMDIITSTQNASLIIMAIITCFVSPLVYGQLTPKKSRKNYKTIIVGGSTTAVLLSRRIKLHGYNALIVEKNAERFNEIKRKGIEVVLSNGKESFAFSDINLMPENFVMVHTGNEAENISVIENLKNEYSHQRIISLAHSKSYNEKLKQMEVDIIDIPSVIAATIENLILRPSTYHAMVESFESFSVEEITITNNEIDGKQVKEIPFHKDGSLMLLRRKNEMYIPKGDTIFALGDIITVIGNEHALEDFRNKFV
jgi:Kef-type K+ transport system membrane component KefB/Trk K+ transport system NAD-binding subunit